MSLTEDKRKILEGLWESLHAITPMELSNKLKMHFPALMMHLVWLKRMGYVYSSKKGYYAITDKGKEILGFPRLTHKLAKEILSSLPNERSFYFFTGIGDYTGNFAKSLEEFSDFLREINIQSIEFHMSRGDFERWISDLGDKELAKRMGLLKKQGLAGIDLRRAIYQTVKTRCQEVKRNI